MSQEISRSQRWYAENASHKNATVTTQQLVDRRLTKNQQAALLAHLTGLSGGVCDCCHGARPSPQPPKIDWHPYLRDDDGAPVLRGVMCRSCKTALNRLVDPSRRHKPTPQQMVWLTEYMNRPWMTPHQAFPGLESRDAHDHGDAQKDAGRRWLDDLLARRQDRSGVRSGVDPGAPAAPTSVPG